MSRGPRIAPPSEAELSSLRAGHKARQDRLWEKVATLDELMDMRTDPREIPQRAGWGHRQSMRRVLQKKKLDNIWKGFLEYDARFDRN